MLYCYDERVPLESYETEIELAKIKKQAIFYNEIDGFKDSEGNKIDITGKVIIPRTFVAQVNQINEVIIDKGGILAVSEVEDEVIDSWPKYYKPKRKAVIVNGEDLINEDVIVEFKKTFGDKIFLKTKYKNFNGIIPLSLLEDKECNFYKAILNNLDKEFIVSGVVNILKDEYGLREYRCFVLNDEVANISRYTEDVLHTIDEDVLEYARRLVADVKGRMPSYYVVDLFEYEVDGKKEIDVVEFNPIQASGIYLYNSAIEFSRDILHRNISNVASEYKDEIEECSLSGEMINKRESLFKVPLSFANDLMSFCVSGSLGIRFFRDVEITVDDYAKHGSKYNYDGGFVPITSDRELRGFSELKPLRSDADLLGSKKLKYRKDDKKDE